MEKNTSIRNESISATVSREPQAAEVDVGVGGAGAIPVESSFGIMLVSVTYFWNGRLSIAYP